MSETSLIKLEPILELIQTFVPAAEAKTNKAMELMAAITAIEDDDDVEYVEQLLGKVKPIYDEYSALRKAITEQTDSLKENLMVYEKRVSYDGKQDNHYTRLRKLLIAYNQVKLEAKQKVEREAELRRQKEDYKVELETQIKKNLAQMVIDRVVEVNDGAKKHFDNATLENFDEEAKKFMGFKPLLKEERYNKCFDAAFDNTKLNDEELKAFVEECKTREPFDKWRDFVVDGITPVINDWRAKIPSLKEEKILVANAKSEEDKKRIEAEQKKKADEEEARKTREFDKLKTEANNAIDNEAEVNKMGNAFQQQGTVQDLGVKGPVKLFVRFTDEKNVVKPLANIIYNCFLSPKFPGIYKLDKSKQPVVDEFNNKQYNEHIEWFLDFFVKNCDAKVPGVEIKEVAKVIIRK